MFNIYVSIVQYGSKSDFFSHFSRERKNNADITDRNMY